MDKKEYLNRLKRIVGFKRKTINLFSEQIDNYNYIKENFKLPKHTYNVGDNVLLKKGMFLRGEGSTSKVDNDKLKFISENGFITPDLLYKYNKNQKTPLTIQVWNIQKDMTLAEYINLYSGGTIKKVLLDRTIETELIPYNKIDNYVNNLTGIWTWTLEQTKENRFMPSLSNTSFQIAFIMNTLDDSLKPLLKNDIFDLSFDKKVIKTFIPNFFLRDFIYSKRDDFTTNRESAILFGIPANLIEGILVGRLYESNIKVLEYIKILFPDCYICNLDGKVIMK